MQLKRLKDVFSVFQIPLAMVQYDANEANRNRYREPIDDANTRAMSAVLKVKYEDVLEEQLQTAAFMRCNSNHVTVMDFMMEKRGYQIFKVEKPYTVLAFIISNPNGRYVICTEKKAIAVIDTNIVDICDEDETVDEHLERIFSQLITRVYELKPESERQIFEGSPEGKKTDEAPKPIKKSRRKTKPKETK